MRRNASVEIVVGTLTILGLGGLFAFSYTVDSRASSGYALVARYRAVDGLAETAPVWLAGVHVGSVEHVRFDPEFRDAVVTMRIQNGVKLPMDSSASIMSASLLGGKYILLSPGGEKELMGEGDEFQYVQNSVIMEEVLQVIVRAAERRAEERKAQRERKDAPKP